MKLKNRIGLLLLCLALITAVMPVGVYADTALEISDIEYNTLNVTFNSNLAGETAVVLFVDYVAWDDLTFKGVKIVPITTVEGENTLSVPSDVDLFAGDKILIWKDMTTIRPLCDAYKVTGTETPVVDTTPGIDLPVDRN